MGAAAVPIIAAVAASAAGAVIANEMAPEPVQAPEPIAPPAPPKIPEAEEVIDPTDVIGEEQDRLRDLKRRATARTKGGSLLNSEDDSSAELTLLGGK